MTEVEAEAVFVQSALLGAKSCVGMPVALPKGLGFMRAAVAVKGGVLTLLLMALSLLLSSLLKSVSKGGDPRGVLEAFGGDHGAVLPVEAFGGDHGADFVASGIAGAGPEPPELLPEPPELLPEPPELLPEPVALLIASCRKAGSAVSFLLAENGPRRASRMTEEGFCCVCCNKGDDR
jgi:hypothetical protein